MAVVDPRSDKGEAMHDTNVTIVGNALNTPEWRRLDESRTLVAKFKVASTSRRYDRQSNRWVDGSSLRVRVNCWRRLAENVSLCVHVGDPLIITGRLYSREWEGEDNVRRISYELDAVAVGHDLSRGRGRFTRQKANMGTTTVDDDDADTRVAGERSLPVPELNGRPRQRVFDEELGGYVTSVDTAGLDIGSGFSSAAGGPNGDRPNGTGLDERGSAGSGSGGHATNGSGSTGAPVFGGDEDHIEDDPDEPFDSAAFAGLSTSGSVFAATGVGGEDGVDQESDGDTPGGDIAPGEDTTPGGDGTPAEEDPPGEEPTRRRRRGKVGAPA